MKDAHSPSENEIISEALRLQSPEERTTYVEQACGQDARLRQRILEAISRALERDGPATATAAQSPQETIRLSLPDDPPGEKPGDHIGRYKLIEVIGEGGMGRVWAAEQTEPLRRQVALKVVKLGLDTKQVIARFEAERQALALMDHPNIAKVLDAGATMTGRPFFVMELVRGLPITDYCDKHNLTPRDRLQLFVSVCTALHHAHGKGIIHRDIKPSNILVTLQDGLPVPKIIDFGIAKATAGQRLTDKTLHTAMSEFIGTPAYMSPEQAEMSPLSIDTRSDIYSLGVLLYELMTGTTPFDARQLLQAGIEAIRRIIREQDPPRPSTKLSLLDVNRQTTIARHRQTQPPDLIRLVRGDLDWVILKTLEKDRTRRYETAQSLADDVSRFLNNETILARPPSTLHRFGKFARRHKSTLASSSVITILVLALLVSAAYRSNYGNILITSEPSGAAIWESDQMIGTTPCRANNIRAGKLEYRVQLEGYEPCPFTLEVGAKVTTEWKAVLRKPGSPLTVDPELSEFDARILMLQGTVEIMRAGAPTWVLSQNNQVLRPGDRIRTGPNTRVTLKWSDQSVVTFGPSTEVEVLRGRKEIKVITRHGTVGIRG